MTRTTRVPAGAWFVAWAIVGVGAALALLGAMTIGLFVAPVVGLAVVLLLRAKGSTSGVAGVLAGAAVPFWWVAYLNREGPGEICHANSGGTECTQEWSPWPWLVIGVVMVVVSVALFVRSARRRADERLALDNGLPGMHTR
jgi:hypothetical protein